MSHHDRAASYLDGGLSPAQERDFIDHLADCAVCEAALSDEMQLRDHEERLSEPSRRRRDRRRKIGLALGGSPLLASAAVFGVLFFGGGDPSAGQLAWSVEKGPVVMRGAITAQRGDRLIASLVKSDFAHSELRVYRGDHELVARCPGVSAPACHPVDGGIELTITLKSAGEYDLVHLYSRNPLPIHTGDREADIRAVRNAGGAARLETIHVH